MLEIREIRDVARPLCLSELLREQTHQPDEFLHIRIDKREVSRILLRRVQKISVAQIFQGLPDAIVTLFFQPGRPVQNLFGGLALPRSLPARQTYASDSLAAGVGRILLQNMSQLRGIALQYFGTAGELI